MWTRTARFVSGLYYTQLYSYDPDTFEPIWLDVPGQEVQSAILCHMAYESTVGFHPLTPNFPPAPDYPAHRLHSGHRQTGPRPVQTHVPSTLQLYFTLYCLFAAFISILVGSVLGVVSGYYGGWMDGLLQRFVEVVQSIPALPLWMALASVVPITWDPFLIFVIMASIFALTIWTVLAREVRGKVLSFRETDFILAAKEMGASDTRVIFRHLYPHTLSHVIVVLTLQIPQIILAEAFLSFLGLGIQEPLISWGYLMRDSNSLETLGVNPWILAPAAFIVIAVLGFNFLGDGLRDAADPYAIA